MKLVPPGSPNFWHHPFAFIRAERSVVCVGALVICAAIAELAWQQPVVMVLSYAAFAVFTFFLVWSLTDEK